MDSAESDTLPDRTLEGGGRFLCAFTVVSQLHSSLRDSEIYSLQSDRYFPESGSSLALPSHLATKHCMDRIFDSASFRLLTPYPLLQKAKGIIVIVFKERHFKTFVHKIMPTFSFRHSRSGRSIC